MVVCRYEISVLVLKSTSHSLAALAPELSSQTLEEKFHIYAHPCMILCFLRTLRILFYSLVS